MANRLQGSRNHPLGPASQRLSLLFVLRRPVTSAPFPGFGGTTTPSPLCLVSSDLEGGFLGRRWPVASRGRPVAFYHYRGWRPWLRMAMAAVGLIGRGLAFYGGAAVAPLLVGTSTAGVRVCRW